MATKPKTAGIIAVAVLIIVALIAAAYMFLSGPSNSPTPIPATAATATTEPSTPAQQSAAAKLAAIRKKIDEAGHARFTPDQAKIVQDGFRYMADHASDKDVAKFDPTAGFTHYGVSPGDGGMMVLLLDRVDANEGLNLTIDPDSGQVIEAHYWGLKK